jgi:hypothetical protein
MVGAVSTLRVSNGRLELCAAVESGWVPPRAIAEMTSTEFQHFFELSTAYMQWVREKKANVMLDTEQLDAALAATRADADAALAALKAEADAALVTTTSALKADADAALTRKNAELAAAATTMAALRQQLDSLEEKTRTNMELAHKNVMASKDSMIEYLKEELARRDERLHARTRIQQNAALRGRAGEDSFEDLASTLGWTVTRTAGESHMCDFKGVVCGLDVFFEIKNHADVIPSKEVTKFRRDMKEHPEIACGVFIGMQAPVSRSERWLLEWTDDKRPMIFIGELEKDDPCGVLRIAEKFIGLYSYMLRAQDASDVDVAEDLQRRIQNASMYLEMVGGKLRALYNKMVVDKNAADAAYASSITMLKGAREEHAITVQALLGTLVFVCDEDAAPAPAAVPATAEEVTVSVSVAAPAKKKRTKKAPAAEEPAKAVSP